jgi:hypothetical protein
MNSPSQSPSGTVRLQGQRGSNARRYLRRAAHRPAWVWLDDKSSPIPCTISDYSENGVRLTFAQPKPLIRFSLRSEPNAEFGRECAVRWRRGREIGVRFLDGRL